MFNMKIYVIREMYVAMFNMKMYVIREMCTSSDKIPGQELRTTGILKLKLFLMHRFNEFKTFTELPG